MENTNTSAEKELRLIRHWFYRKQKQVDVEVLYEIVSKGESKLFIIKRIRDVETPNPERLIQFGTRKKVMSIPAKY